MGLVCIYKKKKRPEISLFPPCEVQQEDIHLQVKKSSYQELGSASSWSWTSSFQKFEKIHACCLSPHAHNKRINIRKNMEYKLWLQLKNEENVNEES